MSKASLATGSGPVVNPVGGSIWPVSIFWSFIDIGTPAQKFPVAIDSGSFTLNVPTKGCQGCITKAPNNQYDASASSTSQSYPCSFGGCSVGSCSNGQCSYSNTYETCDPTDPSQPCSISGPFYSDVVSWGEAGPVNVTFGGISDQTAGFYQFATVDGVCGMASPSGSQSVFGQLVAQGAVPSNEWALCLHEGSTSNGTISLGGVDQRLLDGEMKYTPDTGFGFYQMNFDGMTVGGQKLSGLGETIIIDSGTNDLLMSQEEIAMFPNFTLSVPNIDLHMTPKDYLLLGQPDIPEGEYCLGVGVIGGGMQIIGDTTMQNYVA